MTRLTRTQWLVLFVGAMTSKGDGALKPKAARAAALQALARHGDLSPLEASRLCRDRKASEP